MDNYDGVFGAPLYSYLYESFLRAWPIKIRFPGPQGTRNCGHLQKAHNVYYV